ncbi:hypothetical protein NC651_034098 [Populus alba x Populus x berolinensis]|nr:hypothetical protein NC651_034098 [Populus alba x Populus x berolinensis]
MNSEAFLGLVHKLDFSLHAQAACKPSLQAGEGVEHVCRRVGGKGAEGEVVIAILRSRRMEMHAKMKTTEGELGGEDFTRGVARERRLRCTCWFVGGLLSINFDFMVSTNHFIYTRLLVLDVKGGGHGMLAFFMQYPNQTTQCFGC